jgi:caffeoyl-CoA O-methyltransferase
MDRFIDSAVEQFAQDHTEPETDLYARLREETYRTMQSPGMQVGLIEGRFLQMLVRLIGARNILEIGMFTGYSTLMMAEALPDDGRLITCEVDPKAEAIARRYFGESPHGHKITIRMGPWTRSRHWPLLWIWFLSMPTRSTTQTIMRHVFPW